MHKIRLQVAMHPSHAVWQKVARQWLRQAQAGMSGLQVSAAMTVSPLVATSAESVESPMATNLLKVGLKQCIQL